MDFKDSILQLTESIKKRKDSITTEEATKNAFIMPMLLALGYDVFDPEEVVPELNCDLIKKKGEKIDYAIIRNGQPILLIECKHCKQSLNLHDTQLQKYFVSSNARFGVLTNGIEYRFYTDLDKANIMDEKPFLVMNMLDLTDHDIEQLKKFHKSYYNEDEILSTASQLQILLAIRDVIGRDFQNPSQEFVRYFVKEISGNKSSAKQIEQYTPLVKKAIGNYINDVITERLNNAIIKEEQGSESKTAPAVEEDEFPKGVVYMNKETGVVTTQKEIEAYNIVRSILRKEVSASRIMFLDYKAYFVVYVDKVSKWICRFYLNNKAYISFPLIEKGSGEEKVIIESIDDIFNYSDKLINVLKSRI